MTNNIPSKQPTIIEVAKTADVSTATVSRFLNDIGAVAEDTAG